MVMLLAAARLAFGEMNFAANPFHGAPPFEAWKHTPLRLQMKPPPGCPDGGVILLTRVGWLREFRLAGLDRAFRKAGVGVDRRRLAGGCVAFPPVEEGGALEPLLK